MKFPSILYVLFSNQILTAKSQQISQSYNENFLQGCSGNLSQKNRNKIKLRVRAASLLSLVSLWTMEKSRNSQFSLLPFASSNCISFEAIIAASFKFFISSFLIASFLAVFGSLFLLLVDFLLCSSSSWVSFSLMMRKENKSKH